MRLSICMMVKNEENNLRRCLDSLNTLRSLIESELIILDTGSIDNTVEIAKQYTDKIYFKEWNNDFSEMRNLSISYAKGEWIFIIDADEELTNPKGLIHFLNKNNKKYAAAAIRLHNVIDSSGKLGPSLNSMRLFKKTPSFRYENKIHNMPVVFGDVLEINSELYHYGYISDDLELMERKFARTSKMLLEELDKDPDNVYFRFQLGTTYDMHNELEMAVTTYSEAFDSIVRCNYNWNEYLYVIGPFVKVLASAGYYERAISMASFGLEIEPDYLDLYYFSGFSKLSINLIDEGISDSVKYIEKLKQIEKLPIYSNPAIQLYTLNSKAECYHNLAYAYNKLNNYSKMSEYAHAVLENENYESPFYGSAAALAIEADINLQAGDRIIALYKTVGEHCWSQIDELIISKTENFEGNKMKESTEWLVQLPSILGELHRSISKAHILKSNNDITKIIQFGIDKHIPVTLLSALINMGSISCLVKELNNETLMKLIGLADEYYPELRNKAQERLLNLIDKHSYEELLEKYILAKYLMIKALGNVDEMDSYDAFVKAGLCLLEKKYTIEFIEARDYLRFTSQEEWLLVQIWHITNRKNNLYMCVQEAINSIPEFGIKTVKWIDARLNNEAFEMRVLEDKLINEVNILLAQGNDSEALNIIEEALAIIPNSIKLILMKSEIFLKITN